MLKSVLISQRQMYMERIERLQISLARRPRDSRHCANYRRTIALFRDLIAVIDQHDGFKREAAQ